MFDSGRVLLLLERIESAINLIEENTSYVKTPDDFTSSSTGMFDLSGACMQLVFIGESVKVLAAKTVFCL